MRTSVLVLWEESRPTVDLALSRSSPPAALYFTVEGDEEALRHQVEIAAHRHDGDDGEELIPVPAGESAEARWGGAAAGEGAEEVPHTPERSRRETQGKGQGGQRRPGGGVEGGLRGLDTGERGRGRD